MNYISSVKILPFEIQFSQFIFGRSEFVFSQFFSYRYNLMKLKESNNLRKDKNFNQRKPSDITVKTNLENTFDLRWAEVKIEGKNIASRSNHASAVHNNKLYVHGGFDADKGLLGDFHCMDISDQAEQYLWIKLSNQCQGQVIKLKSHTSAVYKDSIYLFGGEITPINSSNLTFCYDIPTDKWTKIYPNIDLPKVDSHSVVQKDGKMYVYGGYVPEKATYMTDMYAFDFEKKTWQLFWKGEKEAQPEGRSDFDMIIHEGSIWLFGGSNGKLTLNDFWKFDFTTKKWSKIQGANCPEGRRGHSMISYKDYIFLFGGIQDVTKQKNDVHIYHPGKNEWRKIHTTTNSIYDCSPTLKKSRKDASPSKIAIMKVESTEDHKDVDPMQKILNENRQKKFNQRKKELLKQFEDQPATKSKRNLSPTTESMLKTLQTIGMQENNKNEVRQQIIYDQTHRFIMGKKPCARDGQSVNIFGEKMFIFGGDRHLMAFNDLYYFDLQKGVKSLVIYHDK